MFTVIIPTHERPQLLQRTLMSLVNQTYKDFTTIIVSDSGKYIAPYEALSKLPGSYFYLLRNDTCGPAISRNHGIKLVQSDYALFLDDDDTLEPNHLESLATHINNSNKSADTIYYCDFGVIEEDRSFSPPKQLKQYKKILPEINRENIFVQNIIPNSCLVYPRAVLQAHQYDPSLILFEDWQYLLACLENTELHHLPIDSVCIHKSYVAGEENIRRGNVNNEHLIPTTLQIYKNYSSPNEAVRQQRKERFAVMGIQLSDDYL